MSRIIFCATQFYLDGGYASYRDFFKLVELAGYPVIPLSQLDPQSDNTYIITPLNSEWLDGWDNPSAHIIHWELEWRIDWRADVDTPRGVAETWVSDKAYAQRIGARYVPMGGDARINECPELYPSKVYDVALLSYQTPRRQVITRQLQECGLSIAPNSGLSGYVRSTVLNQSHVMTHTHQEDTTKGVAPLRWCIAAAHKLPIITEMIPDRGIFTPSYMVQAEYGYLAAFTAQMLHDKRLLSDYAGALHQLLCVDYTFRAGVEKHV